MFRTRKRRRRLTTRTGGSTRWAGPTPAWTPPSPGLWSKFFSCSSTAAVLWFVATADGSQRCFCFPSRPSPAFFLFSFPSVRFLLLLLENSSRSRSSARSFKSDVSEGGEGRKHILMYIKLTCVNQLRLPFISAIMRIRPLKAGQRVPDCAAGLFVENLISSCSLALLLSLSLSFP